MQSNSQYQYPADGEIPGKKRVAAHLPFSSLRPDQTHLFSPVVQTFSNRFHLLELARAHPSSPVMEMTHLQNPMIVKHLVGFQWKCHQNNLCQQHPGHLVGKPMEQEQDPKRPHHQTHHVNSTNEILIGPITLGILPGFCCHIKRASFWTDCC
ncbi:unnamed protein product [Arctogadus glacialis]